MEIVYVIGYMMQGAFWGFIVLVVLGLIGICALPFSKSPSFEEELKDKNYVVLESSMKSLLEDKVSRAIKLGFPPIGGISTLNDGVEISYSQAMKIG